MPVHDVGEMPFFGELEPTASDELRRMGTVRRYPRGTALFYEQQHADRVVILLTGRAKLSCLGEEGKEVVLGIRGPGDLIGEMSAIDEIPRSATATALEEVEALVIAGSDFNRFLATHPDASRLVTSTIISRLRDSDRKRLEFAALDTMGRLAARVCELADRFGEVTDEGVRIDLPISQEELAGWTGCSREAISKALHSMRELGWLETRRRSIVVHDLEALRQRQLTA